MALSIIIPTLNEAVALPSTLAAVAGLDPAPVDVIVADGGSTDTTLDVVSAAGVHLVNVGETGRAVQMNAGARAARGDILCFLHADTLLPTDFTRLAEQTLADEATALAGFVSLMQGPKGTRWGTTLHNYIKTWYAPLFFRPVSFVKGCRLLFGDQVMICRADDFRAIGGFDPHQPIMEEADLCLRMVRCGRGRVRQVHRFVRSSDRRVARWGGLKANLIYLYIGALWGLGASPDRLQRYYEDVR